MGEKGNMAWKVATLVCSVLLVGALVAIVILAVGGGDDGDKKALQGQVETLKGQVDDLEDEVSGLEDELAQADADVEESVQEANPSQPSDRDQLEALGEQFAGDDFHVGEIVIDGDWARVSIAPNEPMSAQAELCYYHKVNGVWTFVDCGTGLQYGDIPGAPASIFP